jgi:succinate-semialdehyde dehydrogenase/glutarate-semialdehyde dehydrogenase
MQHLLKDPELWRRGAFVGGEWIDATPHGTYALRNPATDETLVELPRFKEAETANAIDVAHKAFLTWRQTTAKARSEILRRWYELMLRHRDDLATLITLEEGKPLAEAKVEIDYAASFLQWFSEEAKRVRGDVIPAPRETARIVVLKEPIGVCAAITPWNFPAAMITRKAGPALGRAAAWW